MAGRLRARKGLSWDGLPSQHLRNQMSPFFNEASESNVSEGGLM